MRNIFCFEFGVKRYRLPVSKEGEAQCLKKRANKVFENRMAGNA